MFGINAFELFKSNARYLLCLLVYKGNDMEIKSTNSLPDINKTIATVIKLLGVNVKVK